MVELWYDLGFVQPIWKWWETNFDISPVSIPSPSHPPVTIDVKPPYTKFPPSPVQQKHFLSMQKKLLCNVIVFQYRRERTGGNDGKESKELIENTGKRAKNSPKGGWFFCKRIWELCSLLSYLYFFYPSPKPCLISLWQGDGLSGNQPVFASPLGYIT